MSEARTHELPSQARRVLKALDAKAIWRVGIDPLPPQLTAGVAGVLDARGYLQARAPGARWYSPNRRQLGGFESEWAAILDMQDPRVRARPGADGQLARGPLSFDLRVSPEGKARLAELAMTGDTGKSWQAVQDELLKLCEQGSKYTTQDDLAARLGCSPATVNKAIDKSEQLTGWMTEARQDKMTPRATGLTDVVADHTRQATEADPADVLSDDDVDVAMAKLIEQAEPEERAELNASDAARCRALAKAYYQQQRDAEPSPLDDDPPGRRPQIVKENKRL